MNTRFWIALFTILLIFAIPGAIFAQQSDFYGTWTAKITEISDIDTMLITFTISASKFGMLFAHYENNEFIEDEEFEADIANWSSLVNTDRTSRTDYPNGYSISLSAFGFEVGSMEIFISRDRRQFTIPEINEDFNEIIVFRKQ